MKVSLVLFLSLVPLCRAFGASPVTVDIPSGDIRDALRAVADSAGLSILVPGEITGTVSLHAQSMPYAELLTSLLRGRGYAWSVTKEGMIVVEKMGSLPVEVVTVYHRLPVDVQTELAKLLRSGESVHVIGSELVLEAEPDRLQFLRERVKLADNFTRQVFVECRFQEVSAKTSKALGVDWGSLSNYGVSIQPKPLEIGDGKALGAVLTAGQFAAVLSAIDSQAGSRLISCPTIVAQEGKESTVAVGQQYPLPQYTFSHEQGVMQVSGFQFKDIGVLLKVTARFVADAVDLDLEPEVSSVASTTTYAGAGAATLPIIATRRVKTRVCIADGQTVAISGLVTSGKDSGVARVSGAGRIPLLGAIFRRKTQEESSSELVVFVTVRLQASTAVSKPRDSRVSQ